MAYQYVAYTPQGEKTQGQIDASSEQRAEELLWGMDYTIITLKEAKESTGESFALFRKVRTRDLIVFSRQLATLIGSGISILRGLRR